MLTAGQYEIRQAIAHKKTLVLIRESDWLRSFARSVSSPLPPPVFCSPLPPAVCRRVRPAPRQVSALSHGTIDDASRAQRVLPSVCAVHQPTTSYDFYAEQMAAPGECVLSALPSS